MMIIPEFYKGYADLVDDDKCISKLKSESEIAYKFYNNINKKYSCARYANDKWSIQELLGHICDVEQIFVFRLLSFLRNEKQSLSGFDHNDYVKAANFDSQDWDNLRERFVLIRKGTLNLCSTIRDSDLKIIGNANNHDISVEALIYVIAGHEKHHRMIIAERYLP